ncbi:MAG: AgmX/PglI C-terminal domain-containing protein [Bdellovibrionales bacterium]|nr:AgmX/PglI C-terminal domain-containing protein [Bdellovibrionales bacterium]
MSSAVNVEVSPSMVLAVMDAEGKLLRSLKTRAGSLIGFYPAFGFLPEANVADRNDHRAHRGLSNAQTSAEFKIQLGNDGKIQSVGKSSIKARENGEWEVQSSVGSYLLKVLEPAVQGDWKIAHEEEIEEDVDGHAKRRAALLGLLFLLFAAFNAFYRPVVKEEEKLLEPVEVKIVEEKKVVVPKLNYVSEIEVPKDMKQDVKKQLNRAIKQDLGFLGLLGKKNLTKALGGMPTDMKDVSAGAGPGGKEGSGGEMLVGLGQGVKRTTVGNTGMAGLGGIGTKGRGGGAGGYGNSMVGSGEGKGLTAIPLANEVMLDGGLDRAAIAATIAKYISQVRACYEQGLKKSAGLAGQVTMAFEISGSGMLNYARVGKSTLGDGGVEGCISNRMMTWQFPKPVGGVNVKVTYPFLLRPSSG